jgi:hypothetical protein
MANIVEMSNQSREVLFNDMDKITQEAALQGAQLLQKGFKLNLLVQHSLGDHVNKVLTADHLNEEQRKDEIKKLAAYWNQPHLNTSTLYDLRNVAVTFSREFLTSQVEERMVNGNYLTWSHFKELQKISSEKRQLSVLKQIRQNCWSANELALELQGKKDSEVKRSGGRKPSLPKTPNAMLQKIFTTVQLTDNYLTAVAEPLESTFLDMPPKGVDEQFVENINNTLERMDITMQHLKETASKLKEVRKRANTVLAKGETMALAAKKAHADADQGDMEAIDELVDEEHKKKSRRFRGS